MANLLNTCHTDANLVPFFQKISHQWLFLGSFSDLVTVRELPFLSRVSVFLSIIFGESVFDNYLCDREKRP